MINRTKIDDLLADLDGAEICAICGDLFEPDHPAESVCPCCVFQCERAMPNTGAATMMMTWPAAFTISEMVADDEAEATLMLELERADYGAAPAVYEQILRDLGDWDGDSSPLFITTTGD